MRHRIKTFFMGGESFKKEVKKQVRILILFTLGFTIAFTWRQTIFDITESLVILITHIQGETSLSILTSFSITVISLILIWVTARFLQD